MLASRRSFPSQSATLLTCSRIAALLALSRSSLQATSFCFSCALHSNRQLAAAYFSILVIRFSSTIASEALSLLFRLAVSFRSCARLRFAISLNHSVRFTRYANSHLQSNDCCAFFAQILNPCFCFSQRIGFASAS